MKTALQARWRALAPEQQRRAVAGAAALGLALVIGGVILPARALVHSRRAALMEIRRGIADGEAAGRQAQVESQRQRALEAQYQALRQRAGEGRSVAHVLDLISAQAQAHHLEIVTSQPAPDAREAGLVVIGPDLALKSLPFTLRLDGSYQALGEFLGELLDAPYLASVRRMTVTAPDNSRRAVHAVVELVVFVAAGPQVAG